MGYFSTTIKGLSWAGALRLSTRLIAFLRIAILARILTPAQFGVFGIAAFVLVFVEILTETGINVFLIQEKKKIDEYIHTAWIVSIIRGILIAIVIILLAPFIASFFNSAESYSLLVLMGAVPFIRGFINPAIIKFQKELEFQKEFWFRLLIFFVDAATAIILVFLLREPIGLVWGLITGAILEVILSFLLVKPRPRFVFEKARVQRVVGRGKWVTFAGIFDYLFRNLDDMSVGKLLNTSSLGLYQMAYKLSELPITEIAVVAQKVTFPVLTKISNDKKRLQGAFFKMMFGICGLVIPLGVLLIVFSRQVIEVILGAQWLSATSVLQVLAIFGVIRAISGSVSTLFLAIQKQEFVTLVTFANMAGLAVTVVPLVLMFGMVGAGIAAIIGSLLGLFVSLYFAMRILKK
ncbi:MAG: lipopolysaccharide biosynthesis protein [Candidatus Levybacteria bacterium]|nr:lipopolysaccharide biosynthesis protein [Candidatus Levybacteria bacterium]MBI3093212.1 lipopolysaccharide biosynthesis protein [Candidatus Levybacteria bacterium]